MTELFATIVSAVLAALVIIGPEDLHPRVRRDASRLWLRLHRSLWTLVHNVIVHPLLAFAGAVPVVTCSLEWLHDWTSRRAFGPAVVNDVFNLCQEVVAADKSVMLVVVAIYGGDAGLPRVFSNAPDGAAKSEYALIAARNMIADDLGMRAPRPAPSEIEGYDFDAPLVVSKPSH